jgi:hypothetical protein
MTAVTAQPVLELFTVREIDEVFSGVPKVCI